MKLVGPSKVEVSNRTQTRVFYDTHIRPFVILAPIIVGLIILYRGSNDVPHVPKIWVELLTASSALSYISFVYVKSRVILQTATISVVTLGAVRSLAYVRDDVWNPAGVWLLVTGFAFITHARLRLEVGE